MVKNNKASKKMRKKVGKTMNQQQKEGMGVVKAAASSLVLYMISSLLLCFAMSYAISKSSDPNMLVLPCAVATGGVCAAMSGAVMKHLSHMPAMLSGIINAVCTSVLTLVLSLLPSFNKSDNSSFGKALLMVVLTVGSMLGAAISAKKAAKPKKRAR